VLVSGSVQGVGFRWFTVEQARALGVRGWVRNLTDGRVEVWVEGPPDAVEAMLAWLASGPSQAHVQGLERHVETAAGHEGFSVRRSSLL
jgi:acylphosphatase